MRIRSVTGVVLTIVQFSCGQESNSTTKAPVAGEAPPKAAFHQPAPTQPYTDTRYVYTDKHGRQVTIENSLPKGGLIYTSPNGRKYRYAVFWTRMVNETATPFHVSVTPAADSFKIAGVNPNSFGTWLGGVAAANKRSSLPDNYFRLAFPAEKMTVDKAPLFNWGLQDLNVVLDNKLAELSSVQMTVQPQSTDFIYVVVLSDRGVGGAIRAGFHLKHDKLYYRINGQEIYCGQVEGNKLTLSE